MLVFVILVALAGIRAELVGAEYSSSFGFTNLPGIVVSVAVIPLIVIMYLQGRRRGSADA